MSREICWTITAEQDLQEIVEYIFQDNANAAIEVLDRIENRAMTLSEFPLRGRLVPELQITGISHYRELIEAPWRIIYRQLHDEVHIVGVFDSRRGLDVVLLDRIGRM